LLGFLYRHLSEEKLDDYVRRTLLTEAQMDFVEEHLLLCERCRREVDELDDFVNALRSIFAVTAGYD
jgi:hypothetical protein